MVAPDKPEGREAAVCATWKRDGEYLYHCIVSGEVVATVEKHPSYGNGHYAVWSVLGEQGAQFPTLRDAKSHVEQRVQPAPAAPPPAAPPEPYYRAIHDPSCDFRRAGSPHPCTCAPVAAAPSGARETDPLLLALRHAANEAPQGHAVTLEEARDEIISLRARLAEVERDRDWYVAHTLRAAACPCMATVACDEFDVLADAARRATLRGKPT
jgi:hypothetical protein